MFPIKTIILLIVCYNHQVIANGRGQYHGGHGSHQHMPKHQHYVPKPEYGPARSVLEEKELLHDQEHLREDLKEVYTEEEIFKMTTEEIEFHYFKMHDYDNNNLLDGVEMMAAILHIAPYDETLNLGKLGEGHVLSNDEQQKLKKARERLKDQMDHYTSMIDKMLIDSDKDKDGFINYREYKNTRRPNGV